MRGFITAFAMYSKIPMPKCAWDEKSLRYVFCFYPFVGLVITGLELLWFFAAQRLGLSALLYAALATALPILITGGINLDGFIDTVDALCSYGDREKRLRILKDPHIGAFAAIYLACILILELGLFAELYTRGQLLFAAAGFVASRILGGLSVLVIAISESSSLAKSFAIASKKRFTSLVNCLYLLALFIGLAFLNLAMAAFLLALLVAAFFVFKSFALRVFGGMTGDLAGFFTTLCELIFLIFGVIVCF